MKQVQWFPGHMKKTMQDIKSAIKLVDIVFELRDARIPLSSANPAIAQLIQGKKRLVVLTKKDLADQKLTKLWLEHFEMAGVSVVALDVQHDNVNKLFDMSKQLLADKFAHDATRGLKKRPIKAMIVGVPNVGKSSLINKVAHKKATTVGNMPGVTKKEQWIRLHKDMELLDTPGVLQPKFADPVFGLRLAAVGTIKDTILPLEVVVDYILDELKAFYPGALSYRFLGKAEHTLEQLANAEIIEAIGQRRGLYNKGERVDTHQVQLLLLHEFRSGKLGRISLDRDINESAEG